MKTLKSKKLDQPKLKVSRVEKIPFCIFMSALGFVLFSFVLIYLVDLRNFLGSRDLLYSLDQSAFRFHVRPFMFFHLYREGGVAENLQWLFLGATAVISAFIAGSMYNRERIVFCFWIVMAVAFTLMLIEDAGNPRHTLRGYVQAVFSETERGMIGTMAEGIYFTILAAIPVYAFWHYRKPVMADRRSAGYLLTGFIGYGSAAALSFTGTGLGTYLWLGGKVRSAMLFLADDETAGQWLYYEKQAGGPFFHVMLMDWMVEESIELMAAAAFCASAVAFLLYVRRTYGL